HRFHNTYPHSAIMVGDFKLIRFWKTGKMELYNLANDPGEKNDLYKSDSKRAKQLEDRLYSYMRRVNPSLANLYSIGK
ncbi:MAG: sulfatase/phosphatase domain-containing protein, partial [Spirosomataceae bacterium]